MYKMLSHFFYKLIYTTLFVSFSFCFSQNETKWVVDYTNKISYEYAFNKNLTQKTQAKKQNNLLSKNTPYIHFSKNETTENLTSEKQKNTPVFTHQKIKLSFLQLLENPGVYVHNTYYKNFLIDFSYSNLYKLQFSEDKKSFFRFTKHLIFNNLSRDFQTRAPPALYFS